MMTKMKTESTKPIILYDSQLTNPQTDVSDLTKALLPTPLSNIPIMTTTPAPAQNCTKEDVPPEIYNLVMNKLSKNKYKNPASKSEQNDNMIGYQFRQRIFYISDKSEKEILTNSVQNSRIMLIGGMVLSVIGLIGVMDFFK